MSRGLRVVAIVTAGLLLAATGWWWSRPRRLGIILITIDTLRVDRVGAYGSRTTHTPALDSIAAHGIRFNDAYATAPLTLPSHISMLSGLLPVEHTVRTNDGYRVPEGIPLISESLHQAGYRTGAFVSSVVLRSSTGISRGFDRFDDDVGPAGKRQGEETIGRAIDWLKSVGQDRFFLWIHLYDPHLPYNPPEPFASEYGEHQYEAEVAYADHCVGTLLTELARLGLAKRTTVIVVGDHGEGLGDHGERTHGALLYDSTIHVPLLIRPAGGASRPSTVEYPVSTAQIAPTVLALASLPNDGVVPGLLKANATPALVSTETLYLKQQLGWSPMYAARIGRFEVIDAPSPELYDLQADPQEQRNLATTKPEMLEQLRARLHEYMIAAAQRATQISTSSTDSKTLRQLESLGYVGGGRLAGGFAPVAGLNPNARIDEWEQVERGLELSDRGDHIGAATIFESVLKRDPENVLALKFLGAFDLEHGDLAQAIKYNKEVVKTGLHKADALSNLALAYYRAGHLNDALANARAAVRADDGQSAARANLLLILKTMGTEQARAGNTSAAIASFQEAKAADPTNLDITEHLAAVLHEAGRVEEARQMFESIVAAAPDRPGPQLSLAILDVEAGRFREAAARLEQIRQGWPGAYQAEYYLGEAYRGMGDQVRARDAYLACLRETPPNDPIVPVARHALALLK